MESMVSIFRCMAVCLVLLTFMTWVDCTREDPMKRIDQLVEQGDVPEAKKAFKAYVERSENPNVERLYIEFLFKHKMYHDFRQEAPAFLERFPEDKAIQHLQFEYYALMASDAERLGRYEEALDFIVTHLLDPDYIDHPKWESRQTALLRKWYQEAEDQGNRSLQLKVLAQMKSLGLDNLGRSLAPELYKELEKVP